MSSSQSSPPPSSSPSSTLRRSRILSSKLYFDVPSSKVPVIYSPAYNIAFFGIEKMHPFDSSKWGRVCGFLTVDRVLEKKSTVEPLEASMDDLLVVHSESYLNSLKSSPNVAAIMEVPPVALLPNWLVQKKALYPFRKQVGGTILAAKLAKDRGWAINVGGGFHHCCSEKGGGFCVYADISLCIHFAFEQLNISRVMIIDLDAHQGNGHETDFSDDSRVYILDMYNPGIYPFDYEARRYIDQDVKVVVRSNTPRCIGVIFLLFALGLEFSTAKLKVVRAVAILGGLLQIILFMFFCGIIAMFCGGKPSEGIFVGAFLSMSSTAVVLKFLMERNSTNSLHGQVTIGTLILQDCAVGLLFALLPVLGGTSGVFQGVMSMAKLLVVLVAFLAALSMLCRSCIPWFLKLMMSLSSQTNELYQLAAVAFCLLVAWCSDKLGLSLELGSFAAGVMISTTDLAQHTLEQIEPIRNLFAALFLASIGMLIHVHFLWSHVDILLASVLLVVVVKTTIMATVVKGFGYNNKTSLLVGMSLAQIGEFAFVLLGRASNLHLVEGKLYLLLLGTTALSLVTTPFLFKAIPGVMHLGSLLRWFPPDNPAIEILRSDSGKQRMTLVIQAPHDEEANPLAKSS